MATADLTELVDIDPERVDGVRSPASGFPILLMKAVDASGRVNEKPDIAGADKILRQLAVLIQSEAAEMATGELGELYDIQLLSQAAQLMRSFMECEQMNAEMASATKDADPTDSTGQEPAVADAVTKDEETSPAPEAPEVTPEAPVEKSLEELAKEEVAKAVEPLNEVIKGLRDEMALLKSTPIPGGPVVTVPGSQRNDAQRAQHLAEAQRHERLAKEISGNPELTRYHEDKAAEFRKAAQA